MNERFLAYFGFVGMEMNAVECEAEKQHNAHILHSKCISSKYFSIRPLLQGRFKINWEIEFSKEIADHWSLCRICD